MNTTQAVLFDLDGTLLDTAPDLLYALNCLREKHGMPALPAANVRPIVSLGSKALLSAAFGMDESDPKLPHLRQAFLDLYERHLADSTQLFPGITQVFAHLDQRKIPWGIVTNKLSRHTLALLKALKLDHLPGCIICGDTLPTYKPDPAPILHACELLRQDPKNCLYVGDSATDVLASKAAGTRSIVALYGYIGHEEDPYAWQADNYIRDPIELIPLL